MGRISEKVIIRIADIPNPIFHYTTVVVITKDFRKAAEELKVVLTNDDVFDTGEALHIFANDKGVSHLFFHPRADIGTIAHEVWHVVRRLLEFSGAGLDNEVVAYLMGYYAWNVQGIMKAKGSRRKK